MFAIPIGVLMLHLKGVLLALQLKGWHYNGHIPEGGDFETSLVGHQGVEVAWFALVSVLTCFFIFFFIRVRNVTKSQCTLFRSCPSPPIRCRSNFVALPNFQSIGCLACAEAWWSCLLGYTRKPIKRVPTINSISHAYGSVYTSSGRIGWFLFTLGGCKRSGFCVSMPLLRRRKNRPVIVRRTTRLDCVLGRGPSLGYGVLQNKGRWAN